MLGDVAQDDEGRRQDAGDALPKPLMQNPMLAILLSAPNLKRIDG